MKQLSTYVHCDALFDKIDIPNAIFSSQYKDFPYLVIKNFFSEVACARLVHLVQEDEETKRKAQVKKEVIAGIVQADVVEEYRKTNIYKLDERYKKYYDDQFIKYKAVMEEYFTVALTLSTDIQVLEYKEGFFYVKHADDSSEIINKDKQTIGFKLVAPQRKLSTVLFATSHETHVHNGAQNFTGGELMFNYLYNCEGESIKIRPEAGDMIIFPSNPYFSHEVLPVEEGYRLTLVQWHDTI